MFPDDHFSEMVTLAMFFVPSIIVGIALDSSIRSKNFYVSLVLVFMMVLYIYICASSIYIDAVPHWADKCFGDNCPMNQFYLYKIFANSGKILLNARSPLAISATLFVISFAISMKYKSVGRIGKEGS